MKEEIEKVQRLYTKRASLYHLFFIDFLRGGAKIMDFLRKRGYLKSHFKILDAGCGTGNATRALYTIARQNGYEDVTFHAFDLTQAMLDLFWRWIKKVEANNVTLKQADVLNLDQLPSDWNEYDLIVSSAMLEHLPKDKVRQALSGLKRLLKRDGMLVVFITKRSIITRLFIGWLWMAHLYEEDELRQVFYDAGFGKIKITLGWGYSMFAVEAKG